MMDDNSRWMRLDEAEALRQNQQSIEELQRDGSELYKQCQYKQAATCFAKAVSLAKQQGNLSKQCSNYVWEGICYSCDGMEKKALACYLKAEQLEGLDTNHQLINLLNLFDTSMCLHLPRLEIQAILDKLSPFKNPPYINGSKSMVLNLESRFLAACGKNEEALAKAQEAFASRIDTFPCLSENDYFRSLVVAYRKNNQISEAWVILNRWHTEGNSDFANTKRLQLLTELELYYDENKLNEACDVLQHLKAEEQYLGRTGMHPITLNLEILIGVKTNNLDQVKPALTLIFINHRNSEDFDDRYLCYEAFAVFCSASCSIASQEGFKRAESHAKFWLSKAERMAKQLDDLMQASWRTERICKVRKEFEITQVELCLTDN